MKPHKPLSWEGIASRITAETDPIRDSMPFGFATQVVARWRDARRDEVLRRWSLWSLRTALGSAALCGLVVVFHSMKEDSSMLLAPPSAEFVALPLSSR